MAWPLRLSVATAPMQVIGTLAPDGTWLWGWDHRSVPADLAAHARLVRAYGDRHEIAAPTGRMVPASEDAMRSRYWRRTDGFFVGGVGGNDRRYDVTITGDWAARRIAPRLWQVAWTRRQRTRRHTPAASSWHSMTVYA